MTTNFAMIVASTSVFRFTYWLDLITAFVNEIWPPGDTEIWPPCG